MTTPMVRTSCSTAIAAVCLCLSTTAFADTAFADIPPPDSPAAQRRQAVPLRIAEDAEAEVHRIVIPKAVLAKLAGDLPDAGSIAAATPTRSIVAARAVSAAVACGLVAFRRGRADRLAAVLICGLSLAGAGAVLLGELAFAKGALPGQEPRAEHHDQRFRPRPGARSFRSRRVGCPGIPGQRLDQEMYGRICFRQCVARPVTLGGRQTARNSRPNWGDTFLRVTIWAANWIGRGRRRKSTQPGANGVVELAPFEFLDRLAEARKSPSQAGAGRFEKPTSDARVTHQPEDRCGSAIDRASLWPKCRRVDR